ncbi:MAG TPA: helix-turn-helix domain-containing protein [Micromonosporaceae bacterium]
MTSDHAAEQGATSFAERLRGRRMAAGLTQAELAARAGVGVRTVRDLERGRSARPQRTTLELLAGALDLGGADRAGFMAAGRRRTASSTPVGHTRPIPGPRGSADVAGSAGRTSGGTRTLGLPAADELVGRDAELGDLVALVTGGARSVTTLVGLAGVGKTALALAVAHRAAPALPGGVAGITVTAGSSDADALTAIATVFGVARPADLADRLAGTPALLVIDAVERSPAAVLTALEHLARIAPALRVLATGRHAVGLVGERVWPVAPLDVPPPEASDVAFIERFPAAELFLVRLRQVRRDPLEPDELRSVGALVRRLGGLPLAIELAAARGRVLDVTEILTRYGHRVLDLTAPAGAPDVVSVDLRTAVSASYALLTPQEQAGLRRLAAFRNRWSVELAEAILTDEDGRTADPVPLLDRLLALGLVSARGRGTLRFRLLDVVRDFATEQAAATGELVPVRIRHARVFADLARRTAPDLAGAAIGPAVAHLDEVTGDLWAALTASADDDPETALALAASLPRWWRFHGRDVAGRRWLRRLLDDPRTSAADPVVRAWARVGLAQLAAEHGEGPQELPEAQAALATFQQLGDVSGELAARTVLCSLRIATGGYDEARRQGEAALSLATRTGRIRDMIVAQTNLTWHEIRVGDLRAARRRLAAVERLSGQTGDTRLRLLARANLAEVARLDGRYAEAVRLGRQVLRALAGLGDPGHRIRVLGTVGLALAQDGRLAEAEAVLRELRATSGGAAPDDTGRDGTGREMAGERQGQGPYAAIEATIALRRGDRDLAAEWFGVAAQAYAGTRDLRDVAEALVGLVASTEEPIARAAVVDRLVRVCRAGGMTLLPTEQVVVGPPPPVQEAGGGADGPA